MARKPKATKAEEPAQPAREGVDGPGDRASGSKEPPARDGVDAEALRLEEDARREKNWKRWGPYLSERQWATVREDYSADGNCWDSFPHDHARSRAYRWGEDGLLGICDRECRLCFALALWNGKDPILKERLFGLTGPEGNHGEDVKEHYFYLDSTPTHSYMAALYKYPQAEFPYTRLIEENRRRGRQDPEFEVSDTGVFDEGRYFDVTAEYAKGGPDDVLIRITVANRGPEAARVHLLPTLWFRNTWSWGRTSERLDVLPIMRQVGGAIEAEHATLGRFRLCIGQDPEGQAPELLFTENNTNARRLWGIDNATPHVKDAFHARVVGGNRAAVNPESKGTKAAAHYVLEIPAGRSAQVRLRLCEASTAPRAPLGPEFDRVFAEREQEADTFYARRTPLTMPDEERRIARQAYAGLLWSKQFYYYVVDEWMRGDPAQPPPPESRRRGRNHDWSHLFNRDVISMPDKWEYPWYAAWDLAFHMIGFAQIDPRFAKEQMLLFLREWYMHPNGQIPAYEFAFGDVNPPVHAWAIWRIYKITAPRGQRDRDFLERAFQKLLLNFTWWINRKDPEGKHIFAGGFLGLDNIGVFDRSRPLPTGGHLEQADGTAWIAFYCGTMLAMALELAVENPAYEDIASKFFEHFIAITDAINNLGGRGLWDEQDGFYYDQLLLHGQAIPLRVRSLVGIVPLMAVEAIEQSIIDQMHGFKKRMEWFLDHRRDVARYATYLERGGTDRPHRLLAVPSADRLRRVLRYVLDENEFLSPFGVRSLSRIHQQHPYIFRDEGEEYRVDYTPGESTTALFGGNSNWRGPVWFPLNYVLIESLERYHRFFGPAFTVECPVGSGRMVTLADAADEIRQRLNRLFLPDARGVRPCVADDPVMRDRASRNLVLFHEYFHADTGKGLGASHQTGWTALAAPLLADRWWLEDKHRGTVQPSAPRWRR